MPFKKGKSGNPMGRKLGKSNKVTIELRTLIQGFLDDNFATVKTSFMGLSDSNKIRVWIDLLPYVTPKLQNMELRTEFDRLTDSQLDEIIDKLLKKM